MTDAIEQTAPLFAALGDATRLQLITRLCSGEDYSISELTLGTDQSRQGVTKHLKVLATAGMISSERVGRERRYRYRPEIINQMRDYLDTVSRQWENALHRLDDYLNGQ